jgi:hypothetical protein
MFVGVVGHVQEPMPRSRCDIVVDDVVVVGRAVRRQWQGSVAHGKPCRSCEVIVLVSQQDGVGTRQDLALGLRHGIRVDRDFSGRFDGDSLDFVYQRAFSEGRNHQSNIGANQPTDCVDDPSAAVCYREGRGGKEQGSSSEGERGPACKGSSALGFAGRGGGRVARGQGRVSRGIVRCFVAPKAYCHDGLVRSAKGELASGLKTAGRRRAWEDHHIRVYGPEARKRTLGDGQIGGVAIESSPFLSGQGRPPGAAWQREDPHVRWDRRQHCGAGFAPRDDGIGTADLVPNHGCRRICEERSTVATIGRLDSKDVESALAHRRAALVERAFPLPVRQVSHHGAEAPSHTRKTRNAFFTGESEDCDSMLCGRQGPSQSSRANGAFAFGYWGYFVTDYQYVGHASYSLKRDSQNRRVKAEEESG